jgi:hypothetical protein
LHTLIGDNGFIGVSHLSQERARERSEKLDVSEIVGIIEAANLAGASGYTFSTHPTNLQVLAALQRSKTLRDEFELYPVLPYAQGYVRLANEKGMRALVDETLNKLPLMHRAKAVVETGISAVRLDPVGLMRAYVDVELKSYLGVKPENSSIRSVLLHEVVTDLCLGLGNFNLLDAFAQFIREEYHVSPGFVTYNLVRFVELFRQQRMTLEGITIMTPFNSIGYQMSPSRQACETCLSSLSESNVIAMSLLAGGYLTLDQAIEYLQNLSRHVGVAVGVSTRQHAEETFNRLRTLK